MSGTGSHLAAATDRNSSPVRREWWLGHLHPSSRAPGHDVTAIARPWTASRATTTALSTTAVVPKHKGRKRAGDARRGYIIQ